METSAPFQGWDTAPLYAGPDAPELSRDFQAGEASARHFREVWLGRISELDADSLLTALTAYEALHEQLSKPQLYAHLLFAADSERDANKQLSQQAMEFGNRVTREVLFFELEIMQIADDRFAGFLDDPRLANYRHFLAGVRKFRPFALPEREEQLLKQKNLTGCEAFARLFEELSASLRFPFTLEGEEREMTGEELLSLLHQHHVPMAVASSSPTV